MLICKNSRAFHEYEILEQIEAGLVLTGWEVKAIRAKKVSINEAYVRIIKGVVTLIGCHITPEKTSVNGFVSLDQTRSRTLLLHPNQIDKLIGKVEVAGHTLVPLDLHFTRGKIKINVGLAKGKKLHDKRRDQKDRDATREAQVAVKNVRREE